MLVAICSKTGCFAKGKTAEFAPASKPKLAAASLSNQMVLTWPGTCDMVAMTLSISETSELS